MPERSALKTLVSALTLSSALLTSACGNTPVDLAYASTTAPARPAQTPMVATVVASDDRGESELNWIGAIRGGYGNPLKTLTTARPLADVVADAFKAGLQIRGLLGAPGAAPFDVRVSIEELKSDQIARREANVRLKISWQRRGSEHPAFTNTGTADLVTGSILALDVGVFGSVEELRALDARAISTAIDQSLDDPALRSFLRV